MNLSNNYSSKFNIILLIVGLAIQSLPFSGTEVIPIAPSRIVGGTVVTTTFEFPYQISLRYNNRHICGGSIISTTQILTAAHCILSTNPSSFSIQAGITSRSSSTAGQIRSVSRLIVHPSYDKASHRNDIAILVLSSPLVFGSGVNKINLPEAESVIMSGTNLVITGWGATEEQGPSSIELRKATVSTVSLASCRRSYSFSTISDSMICAAASGKDTCQGDSGGPLATSSSSSRSLIGITSFGSGCARPNYPGVYTRVSSFRSWIRTQTGL